MRPVAWLAERSIAVRAITARLGCADCYPSGGLQSLKVSLLVLLSDCRQLLPVHCGKYVP